MQTTWNGKTGTELDFINTNVICVLSCKSDSGCMIVHCFSEDKPRLIFQRFMYAFQAKDNMY